MSAPPNRMWPFGVRQLADIAVKALSPAINDPYTAIQALEHLGVLLAKLVRRPLGSQRLHDDAGTTRVVVPGPDLSCTSTWPPAVPAATGAPNPAWTGPCSRVLATTGMFCHDPADRALLRQTRKARGRRRPADHPTTGRPGTRALARRPRPATARWIVMTAQPTMPPVRLNAVAGWQCNAHGGAVLRILLAAQSLVPPILARALRTQRPRPRAPHEGACDPLPAMPGLWVPPRGSSTPHIERSKPEHVQLRRRADQETLTGLLARLPTTVPGRRPELNVSHLPSLPLLTDARVLCGSMKDLLTRRCLRSSKALQLAAETHLAGIRYFGDCFCR